MCRAALDVEGKDRVQYSLDHPESTSGTLNLFWCLWKSREVWTSSQNDVFKRIKCNKITKETNEIRAHGGLMHNTEGCIIANIEGRAEHNGGGGLETLPRRC